MTQGSLGEQQSLWWSSTQYGCDLIYNMIYIYIHVCTYTHRIQVCYVYRLPTNLPSKSTKFMIIKCIIHLIMDPIPVWDTLNETNSSPLKIGRNPKGNKSSKLKPCIFRGYVTFREGIYIYIQNIFYRPIVSPWLQPGLIVHSPTKGDSTHQSAHML